MVKLLKFNAFLVFVLAGLSSCGQLGEFGGKSSQCGPLLGQWTSGSSTLEVNRNCEFTLEVGMGGSCKNTGLVAVTSETRKTAQMTVTSFSGPSENLCFAGGSHNCEYDVTSVTGNDYLTLRCESVDPITLVKSQIQ